MKDVNKVLLAAAIGLVAGGVIGILLAPEKGSELRKKISSNAKEISEGTIVFIVCDRGDRYVSSNLFQS